MERPLQLSSNSTPLRLVDEDDDVNDDEVVGLHAATAVVNASVYTPMYIIHIRL